jgi:hypothetical protein
VATQQWLSQHNCFRRAFKSAAQLEPSLAHSGIGFIRWQRSMGGLGYELPRDRTQHFEVRRLRAGLDRPSYFL